MQKRFLLLAVLFFVMLKGHTQYTYTWSTFTTTNSGLPDDLVTSLVYGSGDTLWIGTAAGLAYITDSVVFPATDFPAYYITSLAIDRHNHLWIGTAGNGCYKRLAPGNYTEYSASSTSGSLSSNQILAIHHDGDSTWIGTDGEGAFLFYNNGWTQYYSGNHPLSWPIDQVNFITTDSQRRVWWGTSQNGIVRKTPGNSYWKFTPDSGLRSAFVRHIRLAGDSIVWVGMGNTTGDSSLAMLNINTHQLIHYYDQGTGTFQQQNTWQTFIDSYSRKWIASSQLDHGLLAYNDTTWTSFEELTSGILSNRTYAVAEDAGSRIWTGTFRGLSVNKKISTLTVPELPVLIAGVYPNPVMQELHISYTALGLETSVQLFTLTGQCVAQQKIQTLPGEIYNHNMEVYSLPSGLYLLHLRSDNFSKTMKVVKL